MAHENVQILGTYEDLGIWIRNSRLEAGYSQKEFAKMLDCTIEHLSKVENGHRIPSRLMTEYVMDILGYDLIVAVRKK